jgi:N-acetylmuramoyl-L-alanine amidase
MQIKRIYSPNFNKKSRAKKSIKLIIIHYTGMQSESESLIRLCSPKHKVSSHFVINQNGTIHRLVNDNKVAWHAGKSCWGKYKNLNKNSIGIEMVNKGHKYGYNEFKKKQISSLIRVCKDLIKKYKIKKKYIVGHSDIAPLRKKDPGEKFPWDKLAKKNIGIWHSYKNNYLKKFRGTDILKKKYKKQFIKNLTNIGYYFPNKKKSISEKVIKAFQRHYRKELISGLIDKECLIIAQNLQKYL